MSTKTGITITSAALTDDGGGTAAGTIAEITSTYDEAVLSNAIADLVDTVNALTVDVTSIKTAIDSSHSRISS